MDAMSARICFLLFACLVQATTVAAPLVLPGSQELIRQRQQQLLEQQNQRLEELQQLPGSKLRLSRLAPLRDRRAVFQSNVFTCRVPV